MYKVAVAADRLEDHFRRVLHLQYKMAIYKVVRYQGMEGLVEDQVDPSKSLQAQQRFHR